MFLNLSMQRHSLHRLELTTDIESHFITSVGTVTDVISDARNCLFKKLIVRFS